MWTGHVRYFSNYAPLTGIFTSFFPGEGDPTQFVFTKSMAQIASKGWVRDSRQTFNYPDAITQRIRGLGYGNKRIGLVGAENISFEFFDFLKGELPSATFLNATREIFNLRMIKSEEEQSLPVNLPGSPIVLLPDQRDCSSGSTRVRCLCRDERFHVEGGGGKHL